MEAVGSGAAPEGTPGGETVGEAGAGAAGGAGRAGRRGRRRVVAPPTSGQSHEVESDFTDPFSAGDPVTGSGAAGSPQNGDSAGETAHLTTRKPERSSAETPLTAHEQWILSQRPPHWG